MIAYEFYCFDDDKPYDVHFLGILPERREDSLRVTPKSILEMGKGFIGTDSDSHIRNLYFIQVEMH